MTITREMLLDLGFNYTPTDEATETWAHEDEVYVHFLAEGQSVPDGYDAASVSLGQIVEDLLGHAYLRGLKKE